VLNRGAAVAKSFEDTLSDLNATVEIYSAKDGKWGPGVPGNNLPTYMWDPVNETSDLSSLDYFVSRVRSEGWTGGGFGAGKYSPTFNYKEFAPLGGQTSPEAFIREAAKYLPTNFDYSALAAISKRGQVSAAALAEIASSKDRGKFSEDPTSPYGSDFDKLARSHDLLHQEGSEVAIVEYYYLLCDIRDYEVTNNSEANAAPPEAAMRAKAIADKETMWRRAADVYFLNKVDGIIPSTALEAALKPLAVLAFGLQVSADNLINGRFDVSNAQVIGSIGQTFGSHLGELIAGDNRFARLATSTIGGALGRDLASFLRSAAIGESVLTGSLSGSTPISQVVSGSLKSFGSAVDIFTPQNLGSFTTLLLTEAAESLKLNDYERYLFTTSGLDLTDYIAGKLAGINGLETQNELRVFLKDGLQLSDVGNYLTNLTIRYSVGKFIDSVLDPVRGLVKIDSVVEGYWVMAGSTIGSLIGATVGQIGGPVFASIAAKIGETIGYVLSSLTFETLDFFTGGFLSDLFAKRPPFGYVYPVFNLETGLLESDHHFEGKHFSADIADTVNAITDAYLELINGIVTSTKSTISLDGFYPTVSNRHGIFLNHAIFGFDKVGEDEDSRNLTVFLDGVQVYSNDVNKLIRIGVEYEVKKLIFYGGDLVQTRALQAWEDKASEFAQGESLSLMTAYLQIAKDYRTYLDNTETINLLMATSPGSSFTLGWATTLMQAASLGLNRAYVNSNDGAAGTSSGDVILSADANDILFGNAGNDRLASYSGNDTIYGGEGNDSANGGNGDDLLLGDTGDDSLEGGAGNDRVYGYVGNDKIFGGDGDDQLAGEQGDDSVEGGRGDDVIYGDIEGVQGADTLRGGDGSDLIRGGGANDSIFGDAAADRLYGDAGNDSVNGGAGNDYIDGGSGADSLLGDDGNDTILAYDGDDFVSGGMGSDSLYGLAGSDNVAGGAGNDAIWGDTGNDTLVGDDGDDTIDGWFGNDRLIGGSGDDVLIGGAGSDYLDGNEGDDVIYGGSRNLGNSLVGSPTEIANKFTVNPGFKSWGLLYQGSQYTVAQLSQASHEMLVLNPSKSSISDAAASEVLWTKQELHAIANGATTKKLIGYVNTSKVTSSLLEWNAAWTSNGLASGTLTAQGLAQGWLASVDVAQVQTREVNYWQSSWQSLVFQRIDRMISQGFNGAFLDDVSEFFERRVDGLTAGSAEFVNQVAINATAMRDFVVAIRDRADSTTAQKLGVAISELNKTNRFQLYVNGAPYLLQDALQANDAIVQTNIQRVVNDSTSVRYLRAIDGLVAENFFSRAPDTQAYIDYTVQLYGSQGVALLALDSAQVTQQQRIQIIANAVQRGFIPYATENDAYDVLNGTLYDELKLEVESAPSRDTLFGGQGQDSITIGETGGEYVDGYDGIDTLYADWRNSSVARIWVNDGALATIDSLGTSIKGIERLAVSGSQGNDTIVNWVSNTHDSLRGGLGNDILAAGSGDDSLDGGDGDDILHGEAGADTLLGDAGNDSLYGWSDVDRLYGGDGDDKLFGGAQDDLLAGGNGNDELNGDDGADVLNGESGNDKLYGWNDSDSIVGAEGNDLLSGWTGHDTLAGGNGNDQLFGDDGNDVLTGDDGDDIMYGGLNSDTYNFAGNFGFDGVEDYDYVAGSTDVFNFQSLDSSQLWFTKYGNDLRITAIGTGNAVTINRWYENTVFQIEKIKTNDNKTLLASKVDNLVNAMAGLNPPLFGQTTLNQGQQAVLQPVLAANWG
jgi:uncharacterized protein (TIGR01370 family)